MAATAALAQNANRGGFFIEAAVGGTTGSTPRTSYGIVNGDLTLHHAHGTALNIALGGRARISSYAAYEFVVEFQSPIDAFKTQPVAKAYPIAFRFTTPEFYRNFSVYINFRLGGAIGSKGTIKWWDPWEGDNPELLQPGSSDRDFALFEEVCGGAAYEIGFGVNITNHFYAGFTWDAQYMFNQYRNVKAENLHWGMAGLRLGYRF